MLSKDALVSYLQMVSAAATPSEVHSNDEANNQRRQCTRIKIAKTTAYYVSPRRACRGGGEHVFF